MLVYEPLHTTDVWPTLYVLTAASLILLLFYLTPKVRDVLRPSDPETASFTDEERDVLSANGFVVVDNPTQIILLQSQKACRTVYRSNIMGRHPDLGLGDLFDRWLGQCLGSLDSRDRRWSRLKRVFRSLFNKKFNTQDLIEEWDNHIRLNGDSQISESPMNIADFAYSLPLRYILNIVFGPTFVLINSDLLESLRKDAEIIMYNIFNNQNAKNKYYRYLPTSLNRTFNRFERNWAELLDLAAVIRSVETEGVYVELLQNFNQTDLEWENFSQTLAEIIYANQDVAIPSILWLLTHYSLHPMTDSDIDISDYIEEVGRMSPIFPTSMPKIITKEINVNGVVIPPNTSVALDFVALGQSPDWEMDDLLVFRPDRFDELEERSWFVNRFGHGGRKCPGHSLANQLFKDALIYMRENWVLIPVTDGDTNIPDIQDIPTDPTKAFISPIHKVWVIPRDQYLDPTKYGVQRFYYDCNPSYDLAEPTFLAVSVNKRSPYLSDPQNVENIVRYFGERERLTQKPSVIYICDEIAHFNIQAFDRKNPVVAQARALDLGQRLETIFNDTASELGYDIRVRRWADNQFRSGANERLIEYLRQDPNLDQRVDAIAAKFLSYRGEGKANKSHDRKLGLIKEYILHEIPVLVLGIQIDGVHYRLLHYSGSLTHLSKFVNDKSSLHNLVQDIYHNPTFENVFNVIVSSTRIGPKIPGFVGIQI